MKIVAKADIPVLAHCEDINLVQGGVIYVAAICVLIYFIVDILYAVINPNIRLTKGE